MPRNFITNQGAHTLNARLQQLIRHSRELKFLVGYFYFSGLRELYQPLRERENLRLKILVGLEVDRAARQLVEVADPDAAQRSQEDLVDRLLASLTRALNAEQLDTAEFYEQVNFFLRLVEEGRLEIRKTWEPNHAKLYLFCLDESGQELTGSPGRFITGSSNLTYPGLTGRQEFNVEIGDYGWEDAEAYFDALWEEAIPITEVPERKARLIRTVRRRTQVAEITPFEAYALVLKTYLDLYTRRNIMASVRRLMEDRGYIAYRYQLEAVNQALSIIEQYNGVIIADVVGLGKSVIASALARQLGGRGIVISPPALMGDRETRSSGWYKYLGDFGLYDWEVYSVGALDKALEYLRTYGEDVQTVIVDEAHRFRNEDTASYEKLSQICANRQVILLTATPFNNTPADIFALLKLFLPPGRSPLTLDDDLAARFRRYHAEFRRLSYILRYHDAGGEQQRRAARYYRELFDEAPAPLDLTRVRRRVRHLAAEIRRVLEPVLIRRNRLDLRLDPVYRREVTQLSEVADPEQLFYELTEEQSAFYDRVVRDYFGPEGAFRGAIYQPYVYEQGLEAGDRLENEDGDEAQWVYQQQRNLYHFMRRLLVRRFESSFGAFAQSIANFIRVHERVLAFIENSGGRYVLDRRLVEQVYDDPDEIQEALDDFVRRLESLEEPDPRHDRVYDLSRFADAEGFLRDIRADLELFRRIQRELEALDLVAHDPKATRLIQALQAIPERHGPDEPRRKVIVFSEYLDTVRYLQPLLEEAFPGRVLTVAGNLNKGLAETIRRNFDASVPPEQQEDAYDILLTTDKLSEGVNLNRAGAIINLDIPWNPTRVIQRLGRINRIGRKVFETLYIYNFFPTRQGADIVQSQEIAAHKLFLIHNTLGEDAKIFTPDEEPSPAALYHRLNRNPEEEEEESLFTRVRQQFFAIQEEHPDLVERLDDFPPRVKTAKAGAQNDLLVFRRKGLRFFVHRVPDTAAAPPEVQEIALEEALERLACAPDTPRLSLSPRFWPAYETVKRHRDRTRVPLSENALEVRALNNLRSAKRYHRAALGDMISFLQTLIRDLQTYQTLPKHTLRRLVRVEMGPKASSEQVARFRRDLEALRRVLGEHYLHRIEQRVRGFRSEIIIAVEHQTEPTT